MIPAVAREKSGRTAVDLGDRDRVGWWAVRGVNHVLGSAVQECVKSGTTDDGDVGESGHASDPTGGVCLTGVAGWTMANRGSLVRLWCES